MVSSFIDISLWTQNLCCVFFISLSLPSTLEAISFTLIVVPTVFLSQISILCEFNIQVFSLHFNFLLPCIPELTSFLYVTLVLQLMLISPLLFPEWLPSTIILANFIFLVFLCSQEPQSVCIFLFVKSVCLWL